MKDNDIRETPPGLFDRLVDMYGRPFECDTAADAQNTKVPACYYSIRGLESNGRAIRGMVTGLTGRWPAHWFCNPPFSELKTWVEKAWRANQPGLMILPNTKGEQRWWARLVEPYRDGRGSPVNLFGATLPLTTHYLEGRERFWADGKPILTKDGAVGQPRFGLVAFIWR
jgi:hypothetical protein